jgi:hypothetical protein
MFLAAVDERRMRYLERTPDGSVHPTTQTKAHRRTMHRGRSASRQGREIRNRMLQLAAILIALLALAHSFLGERYILTRLFRRGELPRLFGGTEFTRRTLRFAWHLTSILAFGMAALLLQLADGAAAPSLIRTIGWTLVLSGFLPLVHTRGRHLSWVVLLLAGGLCLAASVRAIPA